MQPISSHPWVTNSLRTCAYFGSSSWLACNAATGFRHNNPAARPQRVRARPHKTNHPPAVADQSAFCPGLPLIRKDWQNLRSDQIPHGRYEGWRSALGAKSHCPSAIIWIPAKTQFLFAAWPNPLIVSTEFPQNFKVLSYRYQFVIKSW